MGRQWHFVWCRRHKKCVPKNSLNFFFSWVFSSFFIGLTHFHSFLRSSSHFHFSPPILTFSLSLSLSLLSSMRFSSISVSFHPKLYHTCHQNFHQTRLISSKFQLWLAYIQFTKISYYDYKHRKFGDFLQFRPFKSIISSVELFSFSCHCRVFSNDNWSNKRLAKWKKK